MEITVSSRPTSELYCQVRKELVQETPEERVRQSTLSSLFLLDFPQALVVVEKKLSELCTQQKKLPNRRVDILCYKCSERGLEPLLLIECKAKSFSDRELRQLLGYNFYLGAPYIALVSPSKLLFFDVSTQKSHDMIPSFEKIT